MQTQFCYATRGNFLVFFQSKVYGKISRQFFPAESLLMALKDALKVTRKTFFNPKGWLGFDTLKESSQGFTGIMRGVFGQRPPAAEGEPETFNEAMTRLGLTEEDIHRLQFTYFSYALLFFLMALGVIAYTIWLLIHLYLYSFIIGVAIVGLLLAQTFRFHFLYFQIKHRKLGCTFEEWKSGKIQNKGVDQ
jgi:intracellular multiplication protein IcmV